MARNKEYIPCRYHRGTERRLEGIRDYIASTIPGRPTAEEIDKSTTMRIALDLGLDILERRAEAWRAERAGG